MPSHGFVRLIITAHQKKVKKYKQQKKKPKEYKNDLKLCTRSQAESVNTTTRKCRNNEKKNIYIYIANTMIFVTENQMLFQLVYAARKRKFYLACPFIIVYFFFSYNHSHYICSSNLFVDFIRISSLFIFPLLRFFIYKCLLSSLLETIVHTFFPPIHISQSTFLPSFTLFSASSDFSTSHVFPHLQNKYSALHRLRFERCCL